jgi:hypothetical protein
MSFIRKPTATMLQACLDGLRNLCATEGDRRRVKIERPAHRGGPDEDAGQEAAEDWADRLGNVTSIDSAR